MRDKGTAMDNTKSKYDAARIRCADFLSEMLLKYSSKIRRATIKDIVEFFPPKKKKA